MFISNYLLTSSHQFGFKPKHSTDACIYVLKEAVDFYVGQQSSVYLWFLDATKAFDRVNHDVLTVGWPMKCLLLSWIMSYTYIN